MEQIEEIHRLEAAGLSWSGIAAKLGVSRPTVRKYADLEDFQVPRPVSGRGSKPSILDEFKPVIDQILAADKLVWRKQRHTTQRVFQRLRDEFGYHGGYSLVQRYVKAWRLKDREESRAGGFNQLVWEPGSAQVDFGEADFLEDGAVSRLSFLVVSFPHSNQGFAQVFRGETAECVTQGLSDVFHAVGGVPPLIVFDNAAGVGRRVGDRVCEAEVFRRFRLHHRFQARWCNPNSGHEKGHVENKVGVIRRNWFTPMPIIDDLVVFNQALLVGAVDVDSMHYRKRKKVTVLFTEDQQAMLALPRITFDPVRWVEYVTDKYGMVSVDGTHSYSVSAHHCAVRVMVGFRAHHVEILAMDGTPLAVHQRRYGRKPTASVDQVAMMTALIHKPGAWPQSRLRAWMPNGPAKAFLDGLARPDLVGWLTQIRDQAGTYGLAHTHQALDHLAGQQREFTALDLSVVASRAAGFGLLADPDQGPDLDQYDALLLRTGQP